MPTEYTKIRDSVYKRCLAGDTEGKEPDESCLQYAKRVGAMTYTKRYGKTPQEAAEEIGLIEKIEKLLGLMTDE